MTPNKLSIQAQLHLDTFVEANFRGTLDFGPDTPWAKVPLKQYPEALEILCEKINSLPGGLDRAYIAGKIIESVDRQYRRQLVERNILGKCLGVVYLRLGYGRGEVCVWEDGFTEVARLNNKKHCKNDLRGLGQIWRDAPELFGQALVYEPQSKNIVAANVILWFVSTLEKDASRKTPTLTSQALDDFAWAISGMLENSGPRLSIAAKRAILGLQFLVQAGAQIPPLNVDGQIVDKALDDIKNPVEEGRAALRRAILMGQAKTHEIVEQAKPAPKM